MSPARGRGRTGSTWNVTQRTTVPDDRAREHVLAACAGRWSAGSTRRRGRRTTRAPRRERDSVQATMPLPATPGACAESCSWPNDAATSPRKRRTSEPDHQHRREPLAREERPVRPVVDDVERRLEGAEQRRATTRAGRAADDPDAVKFVADRVDRSTIVDDRALREHPRQLLYEYVDSSARPKTARIET